MLQGTFSVTDMQLHCIITDIIVENWVEKDAYLLPPHQALIYRSGAQRDQFHTWSAHESYVLETGPVLSQIFLQKKLLLIYVKGYPSSDGITNLLAAALLNSHLRNWFRMRSIWVRSWRTGLNIRYRLLMLHDNTMNNATTELTVGLKWSVTFAGVIVSSFPTCIAAGELHGSGCGQAMITSKKTEMGWL